MQHHGSCEGWLPSHMWGCTPAISAPAHLGCPPAPQAPSGAGAGGGASPTLVTWRRLPCCIPAWIPGACKLPLLWDTVRASAVCVWNFAQCILEGSKGRCGEFTKGASGVNNRYTYRLYTGDGCLWHPLQGGCMPTPPCLVQSQVATACMHTAATQAGPPPFC